MTQKSKHIIKVEELLLEQINLSGVVDLVPQEKGLFTHFVDLDSGSEFGVIETEEVESFLLGVAKTLEALGHFGS